MSTVKLKRSAVSGKIPLTTDLQLGEIAINTYDGKLYLKKDDGVESIVDVTAPTLDIVTGAGASTTNAITIGDLTTNGNISVTGTVDGRDVASDGSKLDGIEAGADVTDSTNVQAAGALMDSELTSEASVKALDQGVATTDSPSFTGLTVSGSIDEKVYQVTGTTPALNPANGTIQWWNLTGNSTPTDSLNEGEGITLMIDDGTAYTVTWPSVVWVNNGGSAPTLATSGYTTVALWKIGTTLYGALVGDGT